MAWETANEAVERLRSWADGRCLAGRSGAWRRVVADVFPFHNWAFQEGLLHAENLGGDIELMLGKRAIIGAFPWRYEGLEGCPCRIVAFLDAGENVEAVGDAAKAILGY